MFRVMKSDEPVEWPVTVHIPQDGGKTHKASFTAHFVLLDQIELDDLIGGGDRAFIERVLTGWGEDVQDENGMALPFSAEARDRLARIPYVAGAISRAYLQCISGVDAKN